MSKDNFKEFLSYLQLSIVILAIVCIFIAGNKFLQQKRLVDELLVQQGKYEKLIDSTASYIYKKYDEFLPDTYWKNSVYTDLYKDMECWDRENLRTK